MFSSFIGYFRSLRSLGHQLSIHNNNNDNNINNNQPTSEESGYYNSSSSRNDMCLRFIIIRHSERVDKKYGPDWTQYSFDSIGQYYPCDANMPSTLPRRVNWLDYEVDTPVTSNGLRQSWNVGNTLALYNLPLVACYSSPALRSIQTADKILEGMSRKSKRLLLFLFIKNFLFTT